jgi:hypothetical protein
MPNLQQVEQSKEKKPRKREAFDDLIRKHVIGALGTPFDLLKVQIRSIGDDRYRVNVLVGANVGSGRIANSYFVVVDCDGSIASATPPITKQY